LYVLTHELELHRFAAGCARLHCRLVQGSGDKVAGARQLPLVDGRTHWWTVVGTAQGSAVCMPWHTFRAGLLIALRCGQLAALYRKCPGYLVVLMASSSHVHPYAKRPCHWPLNRVKSVCVGAALLFVLKRTSGRAASMRVAASAAGLATDKHGSKWDVLVWFQNLHGLLDSEHKT
jgi:hypothetical protein